MTDIAIDLSTTPTGLLTARISGTANVAVTKPDGSRTTLVGAFDFTAREPAPPVIIPKGIYPTGVPFRGINRAGGEYGDTWSAGDQTKVPGWNGQTFYTIPSGAQLAAELAYLDGIGFNTIRFPISWERLQHTLLGPLNDIYKAKVLAFVDQCTAANFRVNVDLHGYNRYATGSHIGDQGTAQAASGYIQRVFGDGHLTNAHVIDVWKKLAALFVNNDHVQFNLMNEAHDFPVQSTAYFAFVNEQIAAIRALGAKNLILAPNSRSSDVSHWSTYAPNGGPVDAVAALAVNDPLNNTCFDMHCYHAPTSATSYREAVAGVTAWAKTNKKKLYLSELGADPTKPFAKEAVGNLLQYLNDNADVWIGWSPWNLAPWLLNPVGQYTTDGPSMGFYKPFLTPFIASKGI